jgi:hypothetical protein
MHGDTFYPTALLRAALGTDVGMTWGLMIHVVLAGLFTFLFLRRALGVGFWGALVGGLAYAAGGNVAGLVSPGHDGKLYISALLPLILFLVHRGVRDGRAWSWGALALGVTLAILTPHPQLLQYLLLVAGAYGLYAAFGRDADGVALPRAVAARRLGLAAVAVGLGFLGSAIQYWPVLQYTPWSPRAGGAGWEHAISYSMPPEELLNTYLPQFTGMLDRYWGRNGIHFHSEYIGASVLALAGLAFGAGPGERRRQVWFWTGVLIVATLWALGGYTPFYSIVYALVPGTKYFRAPSTMLYVVSFATAVLAAVGVERALAGGVRTRYALAWVGGAAVVALLAVTGALSNVGLAFAPEQLAQLVEQNASALTVGALRSFVAVALALGVLIAVQRGRLRPAAAGGLLVAVVGLDLWSVVRNYWQFVPPAERTFASDPVVEYLRTQSDSGRVLPLPLPDGAPVTPRDPFFGGDALMAHRVRQTLGYHGNELGRYQHLYGGRGESSNIANPNFWRLTNTRFVLTNAPELPLPGATRVAGPARNAVGSMQYVFRLPGDQPPAWVTPLSVKAPDENVLATVLDPRFDVGRVALFDTAAAVPTQAVPQQLPAPLDLRARVSARAPGRIVVALDRPRRPVPRSWCPRTTTGVAGDRRRPRGTGGPVPTTRWGRSAAVRARPRAAVHEPRYERGKADHDRRVLPRALVAAGPPACGAGESRPTGVGVSTSGPAVRRRGPAAHRRRRHADAWQEGTREGRHRAAGAPGRRPRARDHPDVQRAGERRAHRRRRTRAGRAAARPRRRRRVARRYGRDRGRDSRRVGGPRSRPAQGGEARPRHGLRGRVPVGARA